MVMIMRAGRLLRSGFLKRRNGGIPLVESPKVGLKAGFPSMIPCLNCWAGDRGEVLLKEVLLSWEWDYYKCETTQRPQLRRWIQTVS